MHKPKKKDQQKEKIIAETRSVFLLHAGNKLGVFPILNTVCTELADALFRRASKRAGKVSLLNHSARSAQRFVWLTEFRSFAQSLATNFKNMR